MKPRLSLTVLCLALAGAPAFADATCAWAGGEYSFSEAGLNGTFTINGDCSQMVWSRLSDGPETSALTRSQDGWKGEFEKASVELLENGRNLRITGYGGPMRQTKARRKN